jgi:hypothetical protein
MMLRKYLQAVRMRGGWSWLRILPTGGLLVLVVLNERGGFFKVCSLSPSQKVVASLGPNELTELPRIF